MVKVVGYIRVSIEKQVQETEGLIIQKERIIEFCKKNNYELVKVFVDEGVSGAKDVDERPALQEMLEYCKNPPIQFIIVDKPDRLSRNFENQLYIEMVLKRNKIGILFAANETTNFEENDTEFDRMMKTAMRQLMGVFAELDRKMINKRLSDGKLKKAKSGNKPGGNQTFGYEYSADKKTTVINEAQAKVIRNMFQMRIDGYTLQKIADTLNERKLSVDKKAYLDNDRDKNKIWCNQVVDANLKNVMYIGKVKYKKDIYDGNHEPIIDIDTWNAVHKRVG